MTRNDHIRGLKQGGMTANQICQQLGLTKGQVDHAIYGRDKIVHQETKISDQELISRVAKGDVIPAFFH